MTLDGCLPAPSTTLSLDQQVACYQAHDVSRMRVELQQGLWLSVAVLTALLVVVWWNARR